jgi:ribose transport system substrate-binding protein
MRPAESRKGGTSVTARNATARWIGLAAAGLAAAGIIAGTASAASDPPWKIGVSNTLQGNGWREQMICAVKAQSKVSGKVSSVSVESQTTNAAGQIAQIRRLISQGVNAIIINPADPKALDGVIKQAAQKGITVVTVDQAVSAPEAYQAYNDQVAYGRLGAEWLFKQLGGKGNVVEMRGIAGASADTDRHKGFQQALKKYPNIKVVKSVFTNWTPSTASQQALQLLQSGTKIDGIWTSGIDSGVVNAFKTAGKKPVPVVGANNEGFVSQLLTNKGLKGVAVTNPATIGGVGTAIALDVLSGKKVARVTKLTPQAISNTTASGRTTLKTLNNPKLQAYDPVQLTIKPYTTYTPEQLYSCAGP